ncbi:hypothetical protein [uncultured Roseobacter sp.]|uniref:hypothetical protein n=1 Tax=uncultured Roseobacter sp. TaxID=114847 RepID=UPI00263044AA|nr:hypothetical protein [uncultured Roseobacter sp.]
MKTLTLGEAAKECSRSKATLSKAIKTGKLSATKQDNGAFAIDPAELFRVFPAKEKGEQAEPRRNTIMNTDLAMEIGQIRAELKAEQRLTAEMKDTIGDLRQRLDDEARERRQLTAQITDQRAEKSKKWFWQK